jgi:UDP-glucose 4-epimerase
MRALVTGGAGFIGSNLVRALTESGHRVTVLDNLSTGSRRNLTGVEAELVSDDLRSPAAVRRAIRGNEIVYHLGALPRVGRSIDDPETTHRVNVDGTLNVLIAARDEDCRRVVFASSSSVYGDSSELPKHEGMATLPVSPYAASKLTGEAYCRAFANCYDLDVLALRFFNVFGPHQDPSSQYATAVAAFISSMLGNSRPIIFGDGLQSRDFTFVDNVVDACIRAGERAPEATGETVNIGCGDRVTLLELIALINEILGTDLQPSFGEPRPGDVRHTEASIEKARLLLGYQPSIPVREGLERTIEWFSMDSPTERIR